MVSFRIEPKQTKIIRQAKISIWYNNLTQKEYRMLSFLLSILAGFSFTVLSAAPQKQFPQPLPKEEEEALFIKMATTDNPTEKETARTKLIEHNLRLVAHIVRKYYAASPDHEDLVSIGSIGLIKAIDSFNPANGAKFATYGARCIQNAILS